MPRRRKGHLTGLPPRSVPVPVKAILNHKISHPAFRLYNLILVYSWESGFCDLNNNELAQILGCSRQYVSRLLGDLSANDLVADTTLDNGQRQLRPVDLVDSDKASIVGHRLFEPADETLPTGPANGGRASRDSRTPYPKIVSTAANLNELMSTTDNPGLSTGGNIKPHEEDDESINLVIESSSSSNGGMSTTANLKAGMSTADNLKGQNTENRLSPVDIPQADGDFGRISARWCKYFGDISPAEADLLGDFLDDPELTEAARGYGETAAEWMMARVEETALTKAAKPIKYFRKVLNDWIKNKQRKGKKSDDHNTSPNGNHRSGREQDSLRDARSTLQREIDELERKLGDADVS